MSALHRRAVVTQLLADRGDDLIVVAGLGNPVWDVTAAGDHSLNYYLCGAMGGASTVGLGIALAQPQKRVLVVTGDGELLMQLGSLATIGVAAPKNYAIVVLDNERYAETGNQLTHTGQGVDLSAVARACSFPAVHTIRTQAELDAAVPALRSAPGPHFAVVKIDAERPPLVLPPLDAAYNKNRLRMELLGIP